MAFVSYSPTTSGVDLDKVWRIVQLQLVEAFNFMTEEWDILNSKVPRMRINLSARQIILPLDIEDAVGAASIPEAGWEATPSSPNVVDSEFTWITLHKRFSASRTARQLDKPGNQEAMVIKQITYQGMKAVQVIKRRVGDYFYGYGTGVVAKVSSVSTTDVTLKDLYGESGLGAAADWIRIFKPGAYLAAYTGSTQSADHLQVQIASVNASTGVLTMAEDVSTGGDPWAADDVLVFANSVESTQTDFNRGMTGLLDGIKSASLQNVATASVPNWRAGLIDSTSARWGTVDLRKGKQAIANFGGGTLDFILMSQGVENDLVDGLRDDLRYADAFNLEIDGRAVSKGIQFMSTQRVPPGMVFGMDLNNSVSRIQLLENLATPGWGEAEKIEDRAAFVFPMDWPLQMVYKNRANMALWENKTEQ